METLKLEEKKISSDLIRGHIDTIILYSLTSSDRFAQQISDFVDEKSEKNYQINQATLYSSLKRLENLKFVTSYWNDSGDGRRKFFKITESGKNFVNENLTNWSYSRVIIDKLMGCTYTPDIYASHNNIENNIENTSETASLSVVETSEEKEIQSLITETPQEPISNISDSQTPTINTVIDSNMENLVDENQNNLDDNREEPKKIVDEKEVNFRLILSELIKNAEKPSKQTESKQSVEELSKTTVEDKPEEEKIDFNTSINVENPSPVLINGKIDYSDIVAENTFDGYKIRVSSKETIKRQGNLYVNKLNLFTSLILVIICAIEFLAINFIGNVPVLNNVSSIIAITLFSILFAFNLVKYLFKRNKMIFLNINFDRTLTTSIVVFNLLLVILALNFVLNIDLTNNENFITFIVVPVVTCLNFVVYFIIELLLFKSNLFKTKK